MVRCVRHVALERHRKSAKKFYFKNNKGGVVIKDLSVDVIIILGWMKKVGYS
jgi:hypothetical protein